MGNISAVNNVKSKIISVNKSVLRILLRFLRRNTRGISYRYYSVEKYLYLAQLWLKKIDKVILIYTMGKVGSTTIADSLKALGSDYSVFHLHWLRKERLLKDEKLYMDADRKVNKVKNYRPEYIWRGLFVRKQLWNFNSTCVITLIRDPLERNVSSFFQNLNLFYSYDYKNMLLNKTEEEMVGELVDIFEKSYIYGGVSNEKDGDPIKWIEEELCPVFDLDIYADDFPKDLGWKIYETKKAKILLIRLEDLNAVAKEALKTLLNRNDIVIKRRNIGEKKDYSTLYKLFKEKITIPECYLDKLYGSKFTKHFYSQSEIEAFYKKWNKRY